MAAVDAMELMELTQTINEHLQTIKTQATTIQNLKESLTKRNLEVAKLYNEISLLKNNQAENSKQPYKKEPKNGNKP